jgi:hypothetical protein
MTDLIAGYPKMVDYTTLLSPEVVAIFAGKEGYYSFEPLLAQLIFRLEQEFKREA